MARIPYMEYDNAPDDVKGVYDAIIKDRGGLFNIYKVLGNHAKALRGIATLSTAYRSGDISPELSEIVYLYTSTLNQCHY